MKRFVLILLSIPAVLLSFTASPAAAQEPQEPPTTEEMAAKESERLERLLALEYWQVFYVDSTLQHDYKAMMDEFEGFQKARVSNSDLYQGVQDKWMEKIDSTYRHIFNETQWKAYMKSGAAKMQKAREKRRAKAQQK